MKSLVIERPSFSVIKIVEEGTNGYDKVFLDFETHRVVSKKPKYLVDDETGLPLPYKPLKTSRGNDARLWAFKTANGAVAEVITETVPQKNDFPVYSHFMKHEDVPTFLNNLDENGEEVDIVEL